MFEACLQFVRKYYGGSQEIPSVRSILREVGVSRTKFYQMFPSGLDELCSKLGLPPPEHRLKVTQKASETRRSQRRELDIYLGHCPTCGKPVQANEAMEHMRHERVIEKPVVVERVIEKTIEKPVVVGEVQRVIERPVDRVVREVVKLPVKLQDFDETVAEVVAEEPKSMPEGFASLREKLARRKLLEG